MNLTLKTMKNLLKIAISMILLGPIISLIAQVKISDVSNSTPVASAVLELESTSKGLLTTRMTLAQRNAIASPATGLLIFQTDGTSGYYFYDGAGWQHLVVNVGATTGITPITADATLLKTQNFAVVSGGDFTMKLPVITGADDGLSITIKNIGAYTTQVNVVGNGTSKIDGIDTSKLYRNKSRTFVAYNSHWLLKEKEVELANTFDVGPNESWTTIPEVLEFLGGRRHMLGPSVVRLDGGTYTLTATETVDLDNALTIQGPSYGQAYIEASGIAPGNALFDCVSEVSFKMIGFQGEGKTVSNGLKLQTPYQYHEIKDCTFDGFNKAIDITSNVDVWLFESDISNCTMGVDIAVTGGNDYISFLTSESDFSDCTNGINLTSGDSATISIQNCTFTCATGQMGLNYNGTTFIGIKSFFFTNNTWNNMGSFVNGFDFTLARDANVNIENNSGIENKNPKCKINVINSTLATTTLTTAGTWYKAVWDSIPTPSVYNYIPLKWKVFMNKFIFLPQNHRDIFIIVAGDLSVNLNGATVNIAIVKNGVTTTRYGETTLRIPTLQGGNTSANAPYQFSTVAYIQNIGKNDKFELYVSSANNGDIVKMLDVNIFINSQ
jgi:hypothetical protein